MNYLLLCFSCTLSVHLPLQTLAWSSETDQPIDDFIDKLLKSDKFDQLASKIAEKAVDRIVKIQITNATKTAKSEPVYRVDRNESNEIDNTNSTHTGFMSDEIASLFDKNSPFSKLTLKYVRLIEKKREKQNVRSKVIDKSTTKGRAKTNIARHIKSDRENNIYGHYTKEDTLEKKRKIKLKKVKNVSKPKRNRKTTSTTKMANDNSGHEDHFKENTFESNEPADNTTVVLKSGEEKYYTHIFAHSEETTTTKKKSRTKTSIKTKNDKINMTNVKTKRILARENERLYVFASSSDYENLYIEDFNS